MLLGFWAYDPKLGFPGEPIDPSVEEYVLES